MLETWTRRRNSAQACRSWRESCFCVQAGRTTARWLPSCGCPRECSEDGGIDLSQNADYSPSPCPISNVYVGSWIRPQMLCGKLDFGRFGDKSRTKAGDGGKRRAVFTN